MIYYEISSLKHDFQIHNTNLSSESIRKFFIEKNLIDNLSIKEFYTLPYNRSAYINKSDAERICLLAKLKLKGDFNLSNVNSIKDIVEIEKHTLLTLKDFKDKMIEHYKNPVFVDVVKKEKSALKNKKIHNKKISKNIDNYEININKKKIISIDFEYKQKSRSGVDIKSCSECGVSIYENDKITSYHFIIEDGHKRTGLSKHLIDKFEFGESIKIKSDDLLFILQENIKSADYLISHGIENEYNILVESGLGCSIDNIELLDTLRMFISLDVSKDLKSYRLKDLVRACDIKEDNLHNSGNDAAYTIQSFLEMNKNSKMIKKNIEKMTIDYNFKKIKRKALKF